jgi:DNA-binding NtrC family response regulator
VRKGEKVRNRRVAATMNRQESGMTPAINHTKASVEQPTERLVRGHRATAVVELRVDGQLRRRRLRDSESLTVGSSPACDVVLADAAVSRRHCELRHCGRHVELIDLESRNGVQVGRARVARAWFHDSGSFKVGRSVVELRFVGDARRGEEALPGMVGASAPLRRLAEQVKRCAAVDVPVLLRGESGSGKELVARALHEASTRRRGPYVSVNAATIRGELAASELFGHERGAFSGAVAARDGAFRRAHRGTLFLDEIATLPAEAQSQLLRVAEDGQVWPVGGDRATEVDVRLVTATCEPLDALQSAGAFRGDLLHRLAAVVVVVPPLRERMGDIPALASHLLGAAGLDGLVLSDDAVDELGNHGWPGNVRELRNVLVQAALLADSPVVERWQVAQVLSCRRRISAPRATRRDQAQALLARTGGNISAASRLAGLPRSTFRDLLRGRSPHSRQQSHQSPA